MVPTKGVVTSPPIRTTAGISMRFEIDAESVTSWDREPGSARARGRRSTGERRHRRRALLHARPLTAAALLLLAAPSLPACAAGSAAGAIDAPAPAATRGADSGVVRLQSLPIGAPALAGRWKIELGAVAWAQRDEILAANVAPAPLPEDYGWALLPITFVNLSDEAATPGQFEVILHAGAGTSRIAKWAAFSRECPPSSIRPNSNPTPVSLETSASGCQMPPPRIPSAGSSCTR